MNVVEVVSSKCTDDRIPIPPQTVCTKHFLSSVEQRLEWTKNQLKDLHYNLLTVDLLFIHGSDFCKSSQVIFHRNGKKDNKDACKIQRLTFSHAVYLSKAQQQ